MFAQFIQHVVGEWNKEFQFGSPVTVDWIVQPAHDAKLFQIWQTDGRVSCRSLAGMFHELP